MTLHLNICSDSEVVSPAARASQVDKLLLKHNNLPMNALYWSLQDKANQGIELPMALIMDRRCGIERRAEEAGLPWNLAGGTPLMLAIWAGRVDVAKALLAAGADPNAMDSNGRSCLMVATRTSILESVELLISYGADINAVDEEGSTALHHAAIVGPVSENSLMVAVRRVNRETIASLISYGADINAFDGNGSTPLHYAAYWGVAVLVEPIARAGANLEAADNEGRTPLHDAAYNGNVEAIEAFRYNVAAFEANLTAVDKKGCTPLQVYESRSRSSCSEVVRALLTPK